MLAALRNVLRWNVLRRTVLQWSVLRRRRILLRRNMLRPKRLMLLERRVYAERARTPGSWRQPELDLVQQRLSEYPRPDCAAFGERSVGANTGA
jgi:hypothetical protein